MQARFLLQRMLHYEFWPVWVFYAPFFFQWFYYSIRSGSLLYFMRANPGMEFGGLLQSSKYKALNQIDQAYLPKTVFVPTSTKETNPIEHFDFPFICKPDIGERGKGVALVRNEEDWHKVKKKIKDSFLLQEFVPGELELGILYYKYPNGKSGISSIVSKRFLRVVGDGEKSVKELIENNMRASLREDYFKKKFKNRLDEVLAAEEELVLEEIGNHCRGTTFFNSNHLINQELVNLFEKIAEPLEDFNYGRFDLKVNSIEDLYQGRNIKIIEVNGVNSEPTHIYDPEYSLLRAYKDVSQNLRIVYEIAKENKNRPINNSFRNFLKAVNKQFKS